MQNAAIVLGLAAMGGLTMAIIRLRGAPWPPMWLAVVHGLAAATGLGMLIYTVATSPVPVPQLAQIATGVFVLAALGGAVLFFGFHMAKKALPIPFVIGHGLIAVTAFVMLLLSMRA